MSIKPTAKKKLKREIKTTEDFDKAFDEGANLEEFFDFSKAKSKPGIPANKIRDLTKEAEDAKQVDQKKYPNVASVIKSSKSK